MTESKTEETMSSSLIPFDFDGEAVRVINEGGHALFVAADVTAHLGYRMASDATRLLDDDEKGTRSVRTLGGEQEVAVVTEAGLYRLVMRSNKPEAKPFQKWAAKVIEQVRRTGSYVADPVALLGDPNVLRQLLSSYAERVQALEATVAEAAPKVAIYDRAIDSGDTFGFREACQQIRAATGAGENETRGLMRARGWIQRLGGQLAPAHTGLDRGYVTTRERVFTDRDGSNRVRPELRITPKGIARAIELLIRSEAA